MSKFSLVKEIIQHVEYPALSPQVKKSAELTAQVCPGHKVAKCRLKPFG